MTEQWHQWSFLSMGYSDYWGVLSIFVSHVYFARLSAYVERYHRYYSHAETSINTNTTAYKCHQSHCRKLCFRQQPPPQHEDQLNEQTEQCYSHRHCQLQQAVNTFFFPTMDDVNGDFDWAQTGHHWWNEVHPTWAADRGGLYLVHHWTMTWWVSHYLEKKKR